MQAIGRGAVGVGGTGWRGLAVALWGAAGLVAAGLRVAAQDTMPPAAPQNLRALELSETTAQVSWKPATDNVGVTGYQVFRDGALVGASTITNFTDAGPLDKYRSYEYTVTAGDAAGNTSPPSSAAIFAYRRFPFVMPWEGPSFPSVTDLSGWQTSPANVFVVATNAHLYAGGRLIRFFGANSVSKVCFMPHDLSETVAARLARLGVNCVRFHHMDTGLAPDGIFVNVSSSDPGYKRTLDPAQLDRMDYFIAQLKQRGIYVNLNLHVGRSYPGFTTNGMSKYFKGIDNYMPGMIDLQKEYARDLLTHFNPYTGSAYTNEPAVAFVEISNEDGLIKEWFNGTFGLQLDSLYLNELSAQWNTWLGARYTNNAALESAWAPTGATPYGDELVTNGNFTLGFGAPWTFQVTSPAAALRQIVTNGAPFGSNALQLSISAVSTQDWHVQLYQNGLSLTSGLPYSVRFRARAEPARTLRVGLSQDHTPYQSLTNVTITLTTNWQEHTLVLMPSATDADARLVLGGLGLQAGTVWLANVSVQTGNLLLGRWASWAEGSSGAELLTNPDFAAGFISPWKFQTSAPAAGMWQLLTNSAPNGSNALEVTVTTNNADGGYVQFYQTGLRCTNGQPYSIRFLAKTDLPRSFSIGLKQAASPWSDLGSVTVALDTNWQEYAVAIIGTADDSYARFNLSGLASETGRVWFATFSLKAGTPGIGVLTNETLGNVGYIRKDQFASRSRAAQRDWMQFLWDTERQYWNGMRDYLKGTLGIRALIVGTQTTCSPAPIQGELDVVDTHAYWHHPSFPGVPWDPDNWYTVNEPMAGFPSGGTIPDRAQTRIAGKPFVCTEYNHPAPITYNAETYPLICAYAALQDWDGVFGFNFIKSADLEQDYFNNYFENGMQPAKLVMFPCAAAILRRGDVTAAVPETRATVPADLAVLKTALTDASLNAMDFGVDGLLAFQQRVALATGGVALVQTAFRDTNQPVLNSDTGQLTWDTANRLFLLRAPLVKAVIGHAKQQSFDLGDGVGVTPGTTMQGTNWAAISLLVKEGAGFQSPTGRVLIAAAGYADNHRMLWKTNMGPTNATSSVGTNWGQPPTLLEGVPATITLPVPTNLVTVWALDQRGNPKARMPIADAGGKTTFAIGREYETAWYEAAIGCNLPPIVQITSPADGAKVPWTNNVVMIADATDPEGGSVRIDLYVNGAFFGSSTNAHCSLTWTNPPRGIHTVCAVATDGNGGSTTSAVAQVTVALITTVTLIPAGSVWRYRDDASGAGTSWRGNSFKDTTWKSGPAQLGFGEAAEATLVASNKQWTTYFRRQFYVQDTAGVSNVVARLLCDDGAVVYLNGSEIRRYNLPEAGSISYNTPASSDITGSDETNWIAHSFGTLPFQTGWNLLAVEVHQYTNKSPDLSFDIELTGTQMLADQPSLTVSRAGDATMLFSWPPAPASFRLYTATNLAPPVVWESVADAPVLSHGQWSLRLPISSDESRFYRLWPE